ncbi:HEAT repeat domain-containing protein [Hamadaea tsunoensis]|uniref:HEAT repeat domain-containing protein n=1 Tax=Hamadaea tsunoensis TaxID=53368 RepID=UPI0004032DA8|nr:HEAT repeat domain-containing protein [Hamadaea tsunoensis]
MTIPVDASPGIRIRQAAARYGGPDLAWMCVPVLLGSPVTDEDLLLCLGGPHAQMIIDRGVGDQPYWPQVWAARALLYVWDPAAGPAVVEALADRSWRVREMAAKVCAKREIGEAADHLAALATDPTPRVRAAAARALGIVGEGEHAAVLRRLLDDVDHDVRMRADQALDRLTVRLDRVL